MNGSTIKAESKIKTSHLQSTCKLTPPTNNPLLQGLGER